MLEPVTQFGADWLIICWCYNTWFFQGKRHDLRCSLPHLWYKDTLCMFSLTIYPNYNCAEFYKHLLSPWSLRWSETRDRPQSWSGSNVATLVTRPQLSVTRPPDIMSSVSSLALVTLTSCVMTSEALSLTQVSVPPFGLGGDKVDLGCEYDTQVCRYFSIGWSSKVSS